jgi:hypothetical protein
VTTTAPEPSRGAASRRSFTLPLVIAALGLVINVIVAASMSRTIDEPLHIDYGIKILRGQPDRPVVQFDSKVPITVFNALPRAAAAFLRSHRKFPRLAGMLVDIRMSRWATIAAAFGLCLLIFLYAQSLFGRTAGLFSELLFAMDPNIIAHSTISTTDLYGALGVVLSLYFLRRFLLFPNAKNAALSAFTLALAQLTKFTAGYIYIVVVLILAAVKLYARYGREKRFSIPIRQIGILLGLNVVSFLVVMNVGYLFDRSFTPLARYRFQTATFQRLQEIPFLRSVPVPFPYPVLQGIDWMNYDNSTGIYFGNMVLLGEARGPTLPRKDGFPSYYLVAYLVKEPLGMQIILLVALVWIFRRRSFADLLAGEGLLLVSAVVILIPFSFFSRSQVGIRHVLPVLAICTILSGAAFQGWTNFSRRRRLLLGGCLLYAAVSVGSYYPHMIPYFNEIVIDRTMAYRILSDSNLDYGQDRWEVERFLKDHPDVVLSTCALNGSNFSCESEEATGHVLVSANFAAGVFPRNADYIVRAENLRPIAHVGYAYLLFNVPSR